jgi:hypothetical protein
VQKALARDALGNMCCLTHRIRMLNIRMLSIRQLMLSIRQPAYAKMRCLMHRNRAICPEIRGLLVYGALSY